MPTGPMPTSNMDCHLLRLPAELRWEIHTYLFTGLKISLSRVDSQVPEHARTPWQILFTCRKLWTEDLPTFYHLVTVVLPHEMFVHVLGKRLSPVNMSLLQNLEIHNVYMISGGPDGTRLPQSLRNLVLWEKQMVPHSTHGRLVDLQDEDIRDNLWSHSRLTVRDSLLQLWQQNQQLKVFLWVDLARNKSRRSCVSELIASLIEDHSDNVLGISIIHARACAAYKSTGTTWLGIC
jgi:hypothetical protein